MSGPSPVDIRAGPTSCEGPEVLPRVSPALRDAVHVVPHIVQVLWCEPQPYPIASTPPADPKCVGAALERTGEARKSNVALTSPPL